jgi:hypothetical protein
MQALLNASSRHSQSAPVDVAHVLPKLFKSWDLATFSGLTVRELFGLSQDWSRSERRRVATVVSEITHTILWTTFGMGFDRVWVITMGFQAKK